MTACNSRRSLHSTRKYHASIHVAIACSLLLCACSIKSSSSTANKFVLPNLSDMSQPISSIMTNILLLLFFLRIAAASVRPEVNRELLDFIRHCDLYTPISQTFMSFLPRGIHVDFVEGRVTVDGSQVAPSVVPRILHCLHLIPGTLGVAHVQIGMLSITGEMALYAMEFLHLHEATLHTIELIGCVFDKSALEVLSFARLEALRSLSITRSSLDGAALAALLSTATGLLSTLDISESIYVSWKGAAIAKAVRRFSALQEFVCRDSGLDGNAKELIAALVDMDTLRSVDLNSNQVAPILTAQLQQREVGWTRLRIFDNVPMQLHKTSWLRSLANIQTLSLNCRLNRHKGEKFVAIVTQSLPALRFLAIGQDVLHSVGLAALATGLNGRAIEVATEMEMSCLCGPDASLYAPMAVSVVNNSSFVVLYDFLNTADGHAFDSLRYLSTWFPRVHSYIEKLFRFLHNVPNMERLALIDVYYVELETAPFVFSRLTSLHLFVHAFEDHPQLGATIAALVRMCPQLQTLHVDGTTNSNWITPFVTHLGNFPLPHLETVDWKNVHVATGNIVAVFKWLGTLPALRTLSVSFTEYLELNVINWGAFCNLAPLPLTKLNCRFYWSTRPTLTDILRKMPHLVVLVIETDSPEFSGALTFLPELRTLRAELWDWESMSWLLWGMQWLRQLSTLSMHVHSAHEVRLRDVIDVVAKLPFVVFFDFSSTFLRYSWRHSSRYKDRLTNVREFHVRWH